MSNATNEVVLVDGFDSVAFAVDIRTAKKVSEREIAELVTMLPSVWFRFSKTDTEAIENGDKNPDDCDKLSIIGNNGKHADTFAIHGGYPQEFIL